MQRFDSPRRALAYALAGLAGFVDAAGFLAADRYFVSFMSGNTTRFGVDLLTAPVRAWIPLVLIAGFVVGVMIGAVVSEKSGHWRKSAVLGVVALLLVGGAVSQMFGSVPAMLAFLVLAMGVLNNTFRRDGEVSFGLTYMTGALVRIGQGLAARLLGTGGTGWTDYLLLWLALACGAVFGATCWLYLAGATLWFAAVVASGLALAASRLR